MSFDLTSQTDHRPWPLPDGPWTMRQSCATCSLRTGLCPSTPSVRLCRPPSGSTPSPLRSLDQHRALRMADVRPARLPALPWLSAFPELNVRTYASPRWGRLASSPASSSSASTANPVAVAIARRFFHLPYYRAAIRLDEDARAIRYASLRTPRPRPLASRRVMPPQAVSNPPAGARSITGWPNATASTQPTHAAGPTAPRSTTRPGPFRRLRPRSSKTRSPRPAA